MSLKRNTTVHVPLTGYNRKGFLIIFISMPTNKQTLFCESLIHTSFDDTGISLKIFYTIYIL